MTEHEPNPADTTPTMAPVVGIGGLLSIKSQWPYYVPLLDSPGSALPSKNRFMPIPDRGLGTMEETYGQLEEQFLAVHEQIGEPVVVFGHSLGGRMVTQLALDHPEEISAVACLAGVQDGIEKFSFTGKILKQLLGNPDHAENLLRDSDPMREHRARIAAEWAPHIALQLIAPTYDDLIRAPQGLELELPDGRQPDRKIVVPWMRGVHFGIRDKTAHLENVRELRSLLPAGHVDLPISPPVITTMRKLRRTVAGETAEPAAIYVPAERPIAVPAFA